MKTVDSKKLKKIRGGESFIERSGYRLGRWLMKSHPYSRPPGVGTKQRGGIAY